MDSFDGENSSVSEYDDRHRVVLPDPNLFKGVQVRRRNRRKHGLRDDYDKDPNTVSQYDDMTHHEY